MSDLLTIQTEIKECIEIIDGDANIWKLFADVQLYNKVLDYLASRYDNKIDVILGAESRGFIIAQAMAVKMELPFVGVRKAKGFFPGEVYSVNSLEDYKGEQHLLRLQKDALAENSRILMADDWIETGNQAMAVKSLVKAANCEFVGVATIVDQTTEERRQELGHYTHIITNKELYGEQWQKAYK